MLAFQFWSDTTAAHANTTASEPSENGSVLSWLVHEHSHADSKCKPHLLDGRFLCVSMAKDERLRCIIWLDYTCS